MESRTPTPRDRTETADCPRCVAGRLEKGELCVFCFGYGTVERWRAEQERTTQERLARYAAARARRNLTV